MELFHHHTAKSNKIILNYVQLWYFDYLNSERMLHLHVLKEHFTKSTNSDAEKYANL